MSAFAFPMAECDRIAMYAVSCASYARTEQRLAEDLPIAAMDAAAPRAPEPAAPANLHLEIVAALPRTIDPPTTCLATFL